MNRRGEFGENLPPDFGILEDGLYRTNQKRKKVELKQQLPAEKTTKRVKLEKNESLKVCEEPTACEGTEVCEKMCEQTLTLAETVTTDTTCQPDSKSTSYHSLANGEIAEGRYFIQCDIRSQASKSTQVMHDSTPEKSKVKLANGAKGSIINFLKSSQGYSGAQGGSPKLGKADQNDIFESGS